MFNIAATAATRRRRYIFSYLGTNLLISYSRNKAAIEIGVSAQLYNFNIMQNRRYQFSYLGIMIEQENRILKEKNTVI